MRILALTTAVLAIMSCKGAEAVEGDTSGAESDTDTDTDADSDADSDAWTPGEPVFVIKMDGDEWEGEPGHWAVLGSDSTFLAIQDKGEISFIVEVAGDIGETGTYDIDSIQYVKTIGATGYEFQYQATGDGSQTLTIEGLDDDEEYVWATMAGSFTAINSVAVGDEELVMTDLEIESWPAFGAR